MTQEKVDSELTRLHKEIEVVENTLIDMEDNREEHPDIMEFYVERDRIRTRLDTIYEFLSIIWHERISDFIRNTDQIIKCGRPLDWKSEQLKAKKAQVYYNLKFKDIES